MSYPPVRFVLISGASTGIGRASALHLASLGFSVFAGVRRSEDIVSIEEQSKAVRTGTRGTLQGLLLDVTSEESIRSAVDQLRAKTAGCGFCGLVNNAGIAVPGPVEFVPIADWKRQFDVNFFGTIALTQAMLPLLRDYVAVAGLGSARIVMISSIGGRISQPILGPYTASKFAMEALADTLRIELSEQGISTHVLEPGAISTEIWGKAEQGIASNPPDELTCRLYGRLIATVQKAAANSAKNAIGADRVAVAVATCLSHRKPKTRYVIGRDAKAGAMLRNLLPDRWFDAVLKKALGL